MFNPSVLILICACVGGGAVGAFVVVSHLFQKLNCIKNKLASHETVLSILESRVKNIEQELLKKVKK